MQQSAVYIMASKKNGTIYTGVTADLPRRVYEHQEGINKGFTKRYGCKLLVFFEFHEIIGLAILREKQIKKLSRKKN